jgi:hypothetical protein
MKKFLNTLLALFTGIPILWILMIVVSVIIGLIFNVRVGFWTLFFLVAGMTIFVIGRQIYWFITKTGDYSNKE